MPGRPLDGKGGLLCAIPPSEREGTTGFFCIVVGVTGWGLESEQVKERLRGVGTGGRSESPSAALEVAKMWSGIVRWSLWGWSWSLPQPCDFAIEPYNGLSSIVDTWSNSTLGNRGSVSNMFLLNRISYWSFVCTTQTTNRHLLRIRFSCGTACAHIKTTLLGLFTSLSRRRILWWPTITPAFICHIAFLEGHSHVIGVRDIMCLCDRRPKPKDKKNDHTEELWMRDFDHRWKMSYLFRSFPLPFVVPVSSFSVSVLMKSESRAK